jgi:hypothetical protein
MTVDACATEKGESPAWSFKGNALRRPQSGTLGQGLFELRGKQIRLFYMFLPNRVAVLPDGEIKKQDAVPAATLRRVRQYQALIMKRQSAIASREKKR